MTSTDDGNETHREKMKAMQKKHRAKISRTRDEKGLLMVNTGDGKGKSSAALGMVLRCLGWGKRVGVVQFIKGTWETGEQKFLSRFPDLITWKAMGEGFTWDTQNREADIAAARRAWDAAKAMIESGDYDFILLDELNVVLDLDYLPGDEIVGYLTRKPANLHIAVTGRGAPPALIEAADLVTEMRPIKHPFDAGIKAQKGIEF